MACARHSSNRQDGFGRLKGRRPKGVPVPTLRQAGTQTRMRYLTAIIAMLAGAISLVAAGCPIQVPILTPPQLASMTRSTSIALTSDDARIVVVNRPANSVSIIAMYAWLDNEIAIKLAELPVGQDPRCVAISPDDNTVYVTNGASGTVSVIDFTASEVFEVMADIPVGTEPRGCAVTPNGTRLFVANHTSGTVSVIDAATRTVVGTITVGGNPTAIVITNDGDYDDDDETVFVTQFFAQLMPDGPGEGFDEGRRGIVHAFSSAASGTSITSIPLSPIADAGVTSDRTHFCAAGNADVHSEIFCPDTRVTDPTDGRLTGDPQGAFPNQLGCSLIRGNRLFVPSVGAGPAPPVQFNANVQAMVHSVDVDTLSEVTREHVNLNQQIETETPPDNPTESLDRLFASEIVAMDANSEGTDFLFVSRGGNYVLRARRDADGRFDISAPSDVQRFQTGNMPTGVAISSDGRRAYVNNEVNASITVIDLEAGRVIERDIATSRVPEPGTFEHAVLVGKLAFHTALGTPDDELFDKDLRDIVPLGSRGKASRNGWSSCASCHPDGLSDGVTWIFADGPRQTVPLDAFFAKNNPTDRRMAGWSGDRGSVTDFNNYARNVQGGTGFAGDPPVADIYDHGVTQGASDALDAMTLWVQTVRPLMMPTPADTDTLARGRELFRVYCASCHGGAKWTKSQVVYADNPAFSSDPASGGTPRDPGVTQGGAQIVSYTANGANLILAENVATFDATNTLEIRGTGSAIGQTALGAAGYNVPSLLNVAYHAPYFHHGAAQTLNDVFSQHALGAATIATTLNDAECQDLEVFLNAIDSRTKPMSSETDTFRDALAK